MISINVAYISVTIEPTPRLGNAWLYRGDVDALKQQANEWAEALTEVDTALREMGDVENLIMVMKEELQATLQLAKSS